MFLPFSRQAKLWEPQGLSLRRPAGVTIQDPLDPWRLAPKVGLRVIDGRVVFKNLSREDQAQLQAEGKNHWSGGVYPRDSSGKSPCRRPFTQKEG